VSVVRRYRERPSPLVRDAVRGWRTGYIERVLDGNFDLIEARATDREAGILSGDDGPDA
jgi:hypothetical protein